MSSIGLLNPPVGYCLFVASSVAKVSIGQISPSIAFFVMIATVVFLLVTYVEPITMLIPRLFGYAR